MLVYIYIHTYDYTYDIIWLYIWLYIYISVCVCYFTYIYIYKYKIIYMLYHTYIYIHMIVLYICYDIYIYTYTVYVCVWRAQEKTSTLARLWRILSPSVAFHAFYMPIYDWLVCTSLYMCKYNINIYIHAPYHFLHIIPYNFRYHRLIVIYIYSEDFPNMFRFPPPLASFLFFLSSSRAAFRSALVWARWT